MSRINRVPPYLAVGIAVVLVGAMVAAVTAAAAPSTPKAGPNVAPYAGTATEEFYQYNPAGSAENTSDSNWAFLSSSEGSPPELSFTSSKTVAYVTASDDLASQDGDYMGTLLGVCYEEVGSSTVNEVDYQYPEFSSAEDNYFDESVSGVVGGLAAGTYYVGGCVAGQSDAYNGDATVTIELTQTKHGVSYGPMEKPSLHRQ
jgi:hypothetical protein